MLMLEWAVNVGGTIMLDFARVMNGVHSPTKTPIPCPSLRIHLISYNLLDKKPGTLNKRQAT